MRESRLLSFLVALVILGISGRISYGQSPVTMTIGAHCIAYRYASEDKANANDQADCKAAVANNDCGIEELNLKAPAGQQFVYTNAYVTQIKAAFPYADVCQGYYASPPPTPITVTIGASCIKYRYASADRANANDQADCQAAVNDNDCGIEKVNVPVGYQFTYTNAYITEDTKYALPYLDVCQGYIAPQKYPKCVTGHVVPVSNAGECPGKCTLCGQYYCGWTVGGYCSGGTGNACQDPGEGSKIYCDCGTNLQCNCTGSSCGALSPKRQ